MDACCANFKKPAGNRSGEERGKNFCQKLQGKKLLKVVQDGICVWTLKKPNGTELLSSEANGDCATKRP